MKDRQFRAFLNLMMCSDPWPASKEDQVTLEHLAQVESHERGYTDWIEAYHKEPQIPICPECGGSEVVEAMKEGICVEIPCSYCRKEGQP